ncbi:formimidoylglutamase [Pelistega suis]|uniref:Formimidoylglutamase n=1 Tax=Pelistega suis TaxID=1631957 RepID=A0A849P4R1_9BURK|nr:formimidoylglutamase [Pelistega suis]NOL52570.1 formimidoylglutamase [Pelistega suis]
MKNPFQWTGRFDGEGKEHQRLFQVIQPFNSQTKGSCLIGFSSDEGVSRNKGRVGAYHAPDLIRTQLASFPLHHEITLCDAGNISCDDKNLEKAQNNLGDYVLKCLKQGITPIILGGGHEVAYGSFQGSSQFARENNKRIGIINFDAHFDLREDAQATSGTPFYQAYKLSKQNHQDFRYLCLGIARQSNTAILFERANKLNVDYVMDYEMDFSTISSIKHKLAQFLKEVDIVHLSIDLDVFPQSQAPGVSAPAPYGVDYKIIFPLLQYLFESGKTALLEIAEYNPLFDRDNQTAKLAAHIIYEYVHGISKKSTT